MGTCVDCGKRRKLERDHRDYNRPLDVDYVCHSCNVKRGPGIPIRPTDKSRDYELRWSLTPRAAIRRLKDHGFTVDEIAKIRGMKPLWVRQVLMDRR